MKPFKVERTPESSPDVGRKHNCWCSLIRDLIYKKKIRELVYNRVAQYQFFLIDSISIILFPFLSIPISISINLKRAYQYQYVINYWKIPLSISISISINLLPYQYRYQYFSTCLKSSYYKSPAAQIVRQRSGPQSQGQAWVSTSPAKGSLFSLSESNKRS